MTTLAVMVDPSRFTIEATVIDDSNGNYVRQIQFFARVAHGTKGLDDDEEQTYFAQRWPRVA